MSKNIFISGYFSLNGVMDILQEEGYKLHAVYDTGREDVEPVRWSRHIEFDSKEYREREQAMYDVLENVTIGGHPLYPHIYTRNYMANWLVDAFYQANIVTEELDKIEDLQAIVVHNDHDPVYGTAAAYGRNRGIPTFCLYNGFSSQLHPYVGGMQDYRFGHHYCLNGKFVLDYLQNRVGRDFKGRLTGCASWDLYYNKEADRQENTYLYNPGINYDETNRDGTVFAVSTALHPWTFMLRPIEIDATFYEGFAKFQKEVNPDAKLLITTRPYNIVGAVHKMYAERAGVENVEIYTSDDRPFRDLILECEYFISGISSTIQESIITRTPTGFICGREPSEDFFRGRDCYVESVVNADAIRTMLETMGDEKEELVEACDAKASFYNHMDDGKASERSVEYMMDVMEERQ